MILAGRTEGDWDGTSAGDLDFCAIKLAADGTELWRWQVTEAGDAGGSRVPKCTLSMSPRELCRIVAGHLDAYGIVCSTRLSHPGVAKMFEIHRLRKHLPKESEVKDLSPSYDIHAQEMGCKSSGIIITRCLTSVFVQNQDPDCPLKRFHDISKVNRYFRAINNPLLPTDAQGMFLAKIS